MRSLMILVALCCVSPAPAHAACADAVHNGDLCSRYARRVVREQSLATAQSYVKKAEETAKAAMDVAEECEYDDAAGAFYRAARHGGTALKADDLAGIREQAREMLRYCEEGTKAAEERR